MSLVAQLIARHRHDPCAVSLEDQSRRPLHHPGELDGERVELIARGALARESVSDVRGCSPATQGRLAGGLRRGANSAVWFNRLNCGANKTMAARWRSARNELSARCLDGRSDESGNGLANPTHAAVAVAGPADDGSRRLGADEPRAVK